MRRLTHWKRVWCWEGLGAGGEGEERNFQIFQHIIFNIVTIYVKVIHFTYYKKLFQWAIFSSVQFSSFTQSCPTLCEAMNCSTPGLPVHHQLPEFTQTLEVQLCTSSRWCHPAISSSVIPFSSCSYSSQHRGLFQWVNSSHEVAKVLEFQPQHQSFQRNPKTDLL